MPSPLSAVRLVALALLLAAAFAVPMPVSAAAQRTGLAIGLTIAPACPDAAAAPGTHDGAGPPAAARVPPCGARLEHQSRETAAPAPPPAPGAMPAPDLLLIEF